MLDNKQLAVSMVDADKIIVKDPKKYEEMVFFELNELQKQKDNFEDKTKKRIGASEIGTSCERALYYSFNKFPKNENSSRLTRLFNRGKLEEARIFAYLKLMGLNPIATDEEYRQFYFEDFNGAFSGHCDGKIKLSDNEEILLEMKTMNDKSYLETTRSGVFISKPQYYSQVQIYMGYLNLQQTLFVAVNKNTDDIYFQLISFDKLHFEGLKSKAQRIIECEDIDTLFRDSKLPSYFKCKWCAYNNVCYKKWV